MRTSSTVIEAVPRLPTTTPATTVAQVDEQFRDALDGIPIEPLENLDGFAHEKRSGTRLGAGMLEPGPQET